MLHHTGKFVLRRPGFDIAAAAADVSVEVNPFEAQGSREDGLALCVFEGELEHPNVVAAALGALFCSFHFDFPETITSLTEHKNNHRTCF